MLRKMKHEAEPAMNQQKDNRLNPAENPMTAQAPCQGKMENCGAEGIPEDQKATAEKHVRFNRKLTYVIEMSKYCHL